MKILKCYIDNFGKLSDFNFDFKTELNTLVENNGFGKSTLCAFIKTMFYGFPVTKTKNIDENERLKFTPWQGGKFGGQLDFETNGKKYRIVREFGARASADKFSLYDLASGELSDKFSEKLGEELFELDLNGFEKCTYFSNIDLTKDVPNSILARIFDNTDNLNSYENACKTLVKRGRQYKTVGNKGIIGDLEKKLSLYQNKRFETENEINSLARAKEEIENLSAKKDELVKTLQVTREKIQNNAQRSIIREKLNYYNSLVEKTEKLKEKIDAISAKYKNGVPSENEIRDIEQKFVDLSELSEANKNNNNKNSLLTSFIGIISLVLGALCYLFNFYPFILSILFFIISIVSFGLSFSAEKKKKGFKNAENSAFEQLENAFSDIFVNPNSDFSSNIEMLKADFNEIKALQKEYEEYSIRSNEYKKSENLILTDDKALVGDSELDKQKETRLNKEIDSISMRILTLKSRLDRLSGLEDNLLEINLNIEKSEEELENAQNNYEIIKKTYELLENANNNLAVKYKDKVKSNFLDYLSLFSDSGDALLSNKLEVMINEAGEFREVKSFSGGKKVVIEFALRLAISRAVFEKEIPFFVFDDIFSSLDDKTFELISKKIKELSKEIQIIYFTCTEKRAI